MHTKTWRRYFEANALRPLPRVWDDGTVADEARAAVALALARFQAGETGEGRLAHEIDRVTLPGVDGDYRAALKHFIREEGRHARILGDMVRALGGKSCLDTRDRRAFTRVRRLAGVRTKLLVLLAAEVVGIGFYGMLSERIGRGVFADTLREIAGDEQAHLHFHADFFRAQLKGKKERAAFRLAWWTTATAACALVVAVERDTLEALGVSPREQLARYAALIRDVDAEVLGTPAPRERTVERVIRRAEARAIQ